MYFYGGLAKINFDWLQGYPMHYWLRNRTDIDSINSLLSRDISALIFSYSGLFLDLFIGFMLFSNKLKRLAVLPLVIFHFTNHYLWNIGTFPWFSLASILLFFGSVQKMEILPQNILTHNKFRLIFVKGVLFVFFGFQLLLPMRHYLTNHSPSWDGFGDRFAWRMMLVARLSAFKIKVEIPKDNYIGYIDLNMYMNVIQLRNILTTPKDIPRFANFIAKEFEKGGLDKSELYIYPIAWKSVNGREFSLLFDTNQNILSGNYVEFCLPSYINEMKLSNYRRIETNILSQEEFISKKLN